MINIVIPMAGQGSRFQRAGYSLPKPFIDVSGVPMIELVMRNLHMENSKFLLLARLEHEPFLDALRAKLSDIFEIEVIYIERVTEGTACTVLFARELIDNSYPLIVANSDQLVDMRFSKFVSHAQENNLDGSILVFSDLARDPKWSFAKIDAQRKVIEVAEKEPISDLATVGIYYFSEGAWFVRSAVDMIIRKKRVNNEFYTCPVYNEMIRMGGSVGVYEIPSEHMRGLGTPKDLEDYIKEAT